MQRINKKVMRFKNAFFITTLLQIIILLVLPVDEYFLPSKNLNALSCLLIVETAFLRDQDRQTLLMILSALYVGIVRFVGDSLVFDNGSVELTRVVDGAALLWFAVKKKRMENGDS